MSTNQNCVNAKLIRFEFGMSADIPGMVSDFPTPYYFAFIFLKGGVEHKEIFPSSNVGNALELSYLKYIGKVIEKKEEFGLGKVSFIFTDGTRINFG